MKDIGLNLLGSYGKWAVDFVGKEPGPLSFLNPKWASIEELKPKAKKKILELIVMPRLKEKPRVKVVQTYEFDHLHIEELVWQFPYGPVTEAVFMKPIGSEERLPGILGMHDHGGVKYFGKRKIIRTSKSPHPFIENHQWQYYGDRAWANEIAKRGYGVLVHDIFPFGSRRIVASDLPSHVVKRMLKPPLEVEEVKPDDLDRKGSIDDYDVPHGEPAQAIRLYNSFGEQHEHIIARSLFCAGLTWPGIFLVEDMFALDYLCSRPDIDKERVGCCGLSGGGLRTNLLAGIDARVKCSVTAGFMTTWRDFAVNVNYTHTWMVYIPHLPRYMNYPEILGLRAPLPSLVLATDRDPLFTLAEVERSSRLLQRIYTKVQARNAFVFSLYEGPHKFDVPMQEEAFCWFERWLK